MLSAKDIKGAMEVFNIKYEGASMEEGTSGSGAAEAQQLQKKYESVVQEARDRDARHQEQIQEITQNT